ncbi:MAG: protoheme IX farnesyltransferase [Deltaproteobacteria bacterium]|nr:protoheme IX farnesyltransferase [Deltaproteobacteria bacterium]MBW2420984.1 protoheme IX farnesyltransferase [Deltaproteobacteria bacterium]
MSAFSPASASLPESESRGLARAGTVIGNYIALTRPRVLSLVLFTAPPAMVMGHDGWPEIWVLAGVVLGAGLVGGGCGALNAWIERDRDAKMTRTQNRPLPTGRLAPRQAMSFGLAISGLGLLVLLAAGGWPTAGIGLLTLLHYIFVYTLWLKPRSAQNIVIGGAAGAASPLIADAAVDGRLGVWGIVLFAIVFLWTPPHFWAIALYRKKEYEAAGFPMMPSVVGDEACRRKMLTYALVLIPVTLLPWLGGELGAPYALTALAAGGGFVWSIARAIRARNREQDRRVFATSILYLILLFGAMLVEFGLR